MASAPTRVAAGRETKQKLVDAAIERWSVDGLAASFDVIATDVGMTKGAIYHHFGSKNGLLAEVYEEAVKRHSERLSEASAEGSGRERLLGLIDGSARLYGSGTPFYHLLLHLHVAAGASRPDLAPVARRQQRRQRKYLTELVTTGQGDGSIRADISAAALAETVDATLQGFLVQQLEPPSTQRRAVRAFRGLLDTLL
jgi:AcrR family transcriptional regulator